MASGCDARFYGHFDMGAKRKRNLLQVTFDIIGTNSAKIQFFGSVYVSSDWYGCL